MLHIDPFCIKYELITIDPAEVYSEKPPAVVIFWMGVKLVIKWVEYRNFYLKHLCNL
jgi:hypothetical protein